MVEYPFVPVIIVPDCIIDVRYLGNIEHFGLLVIEILFELGPSTTYQYYRFSLVMKMLGVAFSLLGRLGLLRLKRYLFDLLHQVAYIVIEFC